MTYTLLQFLECRICGRDATECGGWLERMNVGELPSIWECRPSCESKLSPDEAVLGAITSSAEDVIWKE